MTGIAAEDLQQLNHYAHILTGSFQDYSEDDLDQLTSIYLDSGYFDRFESDEAVVYSSDGTVDTQASEIRHELLSGVAGYFEEEGFIFEGFTSYRDDDLGRVLDCFELSYQGEKLSLYVDSEVETPMAPEILASFKACVDSGAWVEGAEVQAYQDSLSIVDSNGDVSRVRVGDTAANDFTFAKYVHTSLATLSLPQEFIKAGIVFEGVVEVNNSDVRIEYSFADDSSECGRIGVPIDLGNLGDATPEKVRQAALKNIRADRGLEKKTLAAKAENPALRGESEVASVAYSVTDWPQLDSAQKEELYLSTREALFVDSRTDAGRNQIISAMHDLGQMTGDRRVATILFAIAANSANPELVRVAIDELLKLRVHEASLTSQHAATKLIAYHDGLKNYSWKFQVGQSNNDLTAELLEKIAPKTSTEKSPALAVNE